MPNARFSPTQLQSVFAAMSEGIVAQDIGGRIIFANPAAEALLGLTHDQLLGRTSLDPRWQAVRADGSPLPGSEHPSMRTLASGQRGHGHRSAVRRAALAECQCDADLQ